MKRREKEVPIVLFSPALCRQTKEYCVDSTEKTQQHMARSLLVCKREAAEFEMLMW